MGANGASGDYNLENSLRFRGSAGAYLSRTPTVAGNRKTWTYSAWVKLGDMSTTRLLFLGGTADGSSTRGTNVFIYPSTSGTAPYQLALSSYGIGTNRSAIIFRDPSAWYHIVLSIDTTQATAANRTRLYVNGIENSFDTQYFAQNVDTGINSTTQHEINGNFGVGVGDGYLTEVNFVDGQALTPSDFGNYNSGTGVWQPKEYTGTYGTNGFYLPFNDASSVAALGFDNSGNSNNWTPNNISVYGGTSTSFSTVGTTSWTAPAGVTSIKYLVVAGGGGGGSATTGVNMGGGGGAGGLLQGTLAVTPGNSYTVTIGSGGAANTNGGDSVLGTITATGGGYGARNVVGSTAPSNGGSGGGASAYASNPGSGIAGQGFSGGTSAGSNTAAGGGGSSEVGASVSGGTVGGKGGDGTTLSISGSSVTYAGGGGGGAYAGETGGAGGSGGGGAGGSNAANGANATGYGSGGGGAGQYGNTRIGGSGSSGIVVISYGNSSTYDSMTDVPTLTDEDTANYAVMNPLDLASTSTVMSDGNLKVSHTGAVWNADRATVGVSSGKWYWEVTINVIGYTFAGGVMKTELAILNNTFPGNGSYPSGSSFGYYFTGSKYGGGLNNAAYGASYTNGDTIGTALDLDAGTITFYKNGVSQGVAFTGLSGEFAPSTGLYNTANHLVNFGQQPFRYTPPTGHLKLNTFNLPDSSIVDGSENMNTVTYTGNGTSQSITGVGFEPDLVWLKFRSATGNNELYDTIRGAGNLLVSNSTNAESTNLAKLSSLDSDGFSVGSALSTNTNGGTYAAWNWKAGGTAVSNTNGTITSQVSANPTAGFSVMTYTGTGVAGSVGHGLGVVPKLYIIKQRTDAGNNWIVQTTAVDGSLDYLFLNSTNAKGNSGDALPTSSVLNISGNNDVNGSGDGIVAYCFADVEGYSKIGSYTGNGSTDGPFVYTGFRPAMIIIKRTNSTGDWNIWDNKRNPTNGVDKFLYPSLTNAEGSGAIRLDFTAQGFKLRDTNTKWNANASTYIYMAFAENPFKNSLAR